MAPPQFFVNAASKGFSDLVSGLESTPTGCFVSVDSKGDTEWIQFGDLKVESVVRGAVAKRGDSWSSVNGRGKREQAKACSTGPRSGCFVQEWQAKDLCMTWSVRVANAGLKVVVLSCSCGELVRVAGKGLPDGIFCDAKVEGWFRDDRLVGKGQPLQITRYSIMVR